MKEINGKMLIGIGATVAIGCTCMLYYLLTYDYLTIRSPYVGYELGYQQANIGTEALLSPQMRDRTKATIESELKTNTEKYTYYGWDSLQLHREPHPKQESPLL